MSTGSLLGARVPWLTALPHPPPCARLPASTDRIQHHSRTQPNHGERSHTRAGALQVRGRAQAQEHTTRHAGARGGGRGGTHAGCAPQPSAHRMCRTAAAPPRGWPGPPARGEGREGLGRGETAPAQAPGTNVGLSGRPHELGLLNSCARYPAMGPTVARGGAIRSGSRSRPAWLGPTPARAASSRPRTTKSACTIPKRSAERRCMQKLIARVPRRRFLARRRHLHHFNAAGVCWDASEQVSAAARGC